MANPANSNGDDLSADISTDDQKEISSRLSELGEKLDRVNAKRQDGLEPKKRGNAIGIAYRLTVELVVGLVVGGFIGWWVDKFLGTSPAFLLIFFVLGMAAGIFNVFKAAKMMQIAQEKQGVSVGKPTKTSDDRNDD